MTRLSEAKKRAPFKGWLGSALPVIFIGSSVVAATASDLLAAGFGSVRTAPIERVLPYDATAPSWGRGAIVNAPILKTGSHAVPAWLKKLRAAQKKKQTNNAKPKLKVRPKPRPKLNFNSSANTRRGTAKWSRPTRGRAKGPARSKDGRRVGIAPPLRRGGSVGAKANRRRPVQLISPLRRGNLAVLPQRRPASNSGLGGVGSLRPPKGWRPPGFTAPGRNPNTNPDSTPGRYPGTNPGRTPGQPSGRTPTWPPTTGRTPTWPPPTGRTPTWPSSTGKRPPRFPPSSKAPPWRFPVRPSVKRPPQFVVPPRAIAPAPQRPTLRRPPRLSPPRLSPPVFVPPAPLPSRRATAPDSEPLYRDREVIVVLDGAPSRRAVAALAATNNLQVRRILRSKLLGQSMIRFSYRDNRRVETVVRQLRRDRRVAGVQPNFIYRMKPAVKRAAPAGLPSPLRLQQRTIKQKTGKQKSGNQKSGNQKSGGKKSGQLKPGQKHSAMRSRAARAQNLAPDTIANGAAGGSGDGGVVAPAAVGPGSASGAAEPSTGAQKSWFNPAIQYGLVKVGAARAHTIATGSRIKIAVIDTAIDKSHPVLQGAIVGSFNALDAGGAASSFAKPLPHGTSIAGIIAGRNQVSGVAPNAQILEIVAFVSPSTERAPESSSFSLLRGIDWAFANGARVFNLSFSGPHDASLARMINNAYAKGAILTAAAGNQGAGAPPSFPAAYRNVIAVTATDASDHLYAKANQGGYVTLSAPGVEILTPTLHGGFSYSSGTSFAAAHVSGVIALLLDIDPSLRERTLRRLMMQSARDLGVAGRDPKFGAGLVDAGSAMEQLRGAAPGGKN